MIPVAGMCVGWPSEKGHISPRLAWTARVHQGRYDEGDLAERIDAYDKRRAAIHPYKPRDPARWGDVPFYGWSEDKARQYGVPQRAGLRRVRAEEGIQPRLSEAQSVRRTDRYFFTYFCTRQFSVSATNISSRGLTAM